MNNHSKILSFIFILCLQLSVQAQNEDVFFYQPTEKGLRETYFINAKNVWYTSTSTNKKVKMLTISFQQKGTNTRQDNYQVAFPNKPKEIYKLNIDASGLTITSPNGNEAEATYLNYNYEGTVGGIAIKFFYEPLVPNTTDYKGYYFYEHIGVPIEIDFGRYYPQGSNYLFSTPNGESFETTRNIETEKPKTLNGTWSMQKSKTKLPFKLKRR